MNESLYQNSVGLNAERILIDYKQIYSENTIRIVDMCI
jgi:hypothetical protein